MPIKITLVKFNDNNLKEYLSKLFQNVYKMDD